MCIPTRICIHCFSIKSNSVMNYSVMSSLSCKMNGIDAGIRKYMVLVLGIAGDSEVRENDKINQVGLFNSISKEMI